MSPCLSHILATSGRPGKDTDYRAFKLIQSGQTPSASTTTTTKFYEHSVVIATITTVADTTTRKKPQER